MSFHKAVPPKKTDKSRRINEISDKERVKDRAAGWRIDKVLIDGMAKKTKTNINIPRNILSRKIPFMVRRASDIILTPLRSHKLIKKGLSGKLNPLSSHLDAVFDYLRGPLRSAAMPSGIVIFRR
jgi:hypothetical protein